MPTSLLSLASTGDSLRLSFFNTQSLASLLGLANVPLVRLPNCLDQDLMYTDEQGSFEHMIRLTEAVATKHAKKGAVLWTGQKGRVTMPIQYHTTMRRVDLSPTWTSSGQKFAL